jgi:hypothetical protein
MSQRKNFDSDGSEETAPTSASRTPVVVWVKDGLECVMIVDEPRRPYESVCRCGGCHAPAVAELAAQFLPDR